MSSLKSQEGSWAPGPPSASWAPCCHRYSASRSEPADLLSTQRAKVQTVLSGVSGARRARHPAGRPPGSLMKEACPPGRRAARRVGGWCAAGRTPAARGPPAPELPGGPQHRAQVGDVHLHGAHLGGGPGGQQRGARGLGAAPVPARQAQVQPVVLLQQPLAQRPADATGSDRKGLSTRRPHARLPGRVGASGRGTGGRARCRRAHGLTCSRR